ncbi:MAG: response regulator transcription factor [Clostridia bacterium]|nr:response regulator transcription factor [Clostridia bacterium]
MERILVVEDDACIREELNTLLRAQGYLPVEEAPYDLALLDVNLPGESGFSLCRKLKARSSAPVILLTARDSVEDELTGLGVGADEYIKKPYHPAVLLARIARFFKKNSGLTVRELTLDVPSLTLYFRGRSVLLTKNEMRILYCLMQKPICTKEEIVESLWSDSCYLDENTLYVNINRIREKLKELGAEGYLQTVRGVGYKL